MDSEFRAYSYIERSLGDLGWNTSNPSRGGSVYTQREFGGHDSLLSEALGLQAPENIIQIGWKGRFTYWIIEAKRSHKDASQALKEAQAYANSVNAIEPNSACFATGVVGTPDQSFYVTTTYWNGRKWKEVAINDFETTGFLSHEQCVDILRNNNSDLATFDDDPERFLQKANAINRTLHDNEIPVGDRAKVIAALLLALAKDANMTIHHDPSRLIREINGLIKDLLSDYKKEEFSTVIGLTAPATEKNHFKFRKAIVETLQHLREMNIRSAINSGDDALGKFYETFLKYANGAKEMGIVLTPRHITKFAINAIGVTSKDKVFDPTCGTGGFLISAMDHIRKQNLSSKDFEYFKTDGLYGVEQRDDVFGLAVVNMIFRKDGKSGVYDGNCFDHEFYLENGIIKCVLPNEKFEGGGRDRSPKF